MLTGCVCAMKLRVWSVSRWWPRPPRRCGPPRPGIEHAAGLRIFTQVAVASLGWSGGLPFGRVLSLGGAEKADGRQELMKVGRCLDWQFPDDLDIAMLYVESMMDLRPWGYWMRDGQPHEGPAEIVALTERIMRAHPKHPGALHMYIHLIEPTSTPERAEQAADTLLTLMPAAGHMVHMPAHIYYRVGLYKESLEVNKRAMAVDEQYFSTSPSDPMYKSAYYPHNIHFVLSRNESGAAMAAMLDDRARAHWRATKFYRRLGASLRTKVIAFWRP